MQKSTIYLTIGAGILYLTALLAAKANVKFTVFSHAKFFNVFPGSVTLNAKNLFTSVKGTGARTIWLVTAPSPGLTVLHTAATTVAEVKQLYLK